MVIPRHSHLPPLTPLTGFLNARTDSASSGSTASGTEQRYLKALDLAPTLKQLMGPKAKLQRGDPDSETVRTASDYSYSATSYAGERFRLAGDAAGTCCLLVMPKFLIGHNLFDGSLHRSVLFIRRTPRDDWGCRCCCIGCCIDSRPLF